MTAVADFSAGTIHAAIEIEAAPEAVFDALVEPAQLAAWWGSSDTYRTHDWQIDLRPGGEWSAQATGVVAAQSGVVKGKYVQIERPRLLVYSWQPSWDDFAETLIRVELLPTPKGTSVRITHTGFGDRTASGAGHANGWKRVLGWLERHLLGASG